MHRSPVPFVSKSPVRYTVRREKHDNIHDSGIRTYSRRFPPIPSAVRMHDVLSGRDPERVFCYST